MWVFLYLEVEICWRVIFFKNKKVFSLGKCVFFRGFFKGEGESLCDNFIWVVEEEEGLRVV